MELNDGLSIIIPTYGTPEYLKECIQSIKNQKNNFNYEILLGVDNCKETLQHLKMNKDFYKGIKIYFFKNNVGPFIIKNTLINVVKNDKILFFDSDDIMTENMLSNFHKEIEHVDFIRFNYLNFSDNINKTLNEDLKADTIIGTKKNVLDKIIGFQPWICAADTELYDRLVYNSKTQKTIEGISFYRRIHGKNLTIKKTTNHKSEIRKKYIDILNKNKTQNNWPNPENRVTEEYRKIKLFK